MAMHKHGFQEAGVTLAKRPSPLRRITPRQAVLALVMMATFAVIGSFLVFVYLHNLMQTTATTVVVGNDVRQVNTRAASVNELLESMAIELEDGDVISISKDAPIIEDLVIHVERARPVTIHIDGQRTTVRTTLTNPADILLSEGITVAADDRIFLDGTQVAAADMLTWELPVNQIRIRRSVQVTIVDGERQMEVRTAGESVRDALYEANVTLYLADAVEPDMNDPIDRDMTIKIDRSVPAKVIADGVTIDTRTRGETVADLLVDADVALMGLDYSIPAEAVAVRPGMTVRVIRVAEEVISETEIIPFDEIRQPDPELELDRAQVVQDGTNGILRKDIRIRYENGISVSRTEEGTTVIQEPQDRISAYGTKIVLRSIDTEQGPREYWRVVRLYTSSYHPAAIGGDNITATGRLLTRGVVGVDPTFIPYGSELFVPGYGVGIAADTGAPRDTKLWVELGYDDENHVLWTQYTDVYFLTPIPDSIQYVLPD
ncbi:MAG: ubiquitin-like domain-containing protein [Chloroflexota bacterium]